MLNCLPLVKLDEVTFELRNTQRRVAVLWQEPESLAFVARGREYRSEFHINESDEFTYMISGTMNLHFRTPEGREEVLVIPEGAVNFMPAGTPHSPRFPPDAFALIVERVGGRERSTDFTGSVLSAISSCTRRFLLCRTTGLTLFRRHTGISSKAKPREHARSAET
ncbi:hypothetical protein ACQ5SK_12145 [Bradyrhizobium japonicum]